MLNTMVDPYLLLAAVRLYRGIENQLHWVLDMSFSEGQSPIRQGNAPDKIAVTLHEALNMIKQAKTKRMSIKRMRKAAGWDGTILATILTQVFNEVALPDLTIPLVFF